MTEETFRPSGAHKDEKGDVVVGGTKRSDGTVRKQLRVKPGYVPAEDVPRYTAAVARERRSARAKADSAPSKDSTETKAYSASSGSRRQRTAGNPFTHINAVLSNASKESTSEEPKLRTRRTLELEEKKPKPATTDNDGKDDKKPDDLMDKLANDVAGLSLYNAKLLVDDKEGGRTPVNKEKPSSKSAEELRAEMMERRLKHRQQKIQSETQKKDSWKSISAQKVSDECKDRIVGEKTCSDGSKSDRLPRETGTAGESPAKPDED